MPAVFKAHTDWSTKVKTRDLNDWLQMAVERHPPPAVGGRRVKPKYMAQTKARPPTFVLFASRADQLPDHYRRYLINSLRESFDLPGVPMRLTVTLEQEPLRRGRGEGRPGPATRARTSRRRSARSLGQGRRKARRRRRRATAPRQPKPKAKPKTKQVDKARHDPDAAGPPS